MPASEDYRTYYAPHQTVALRPALLDRPLVVQNTAIMALHRDQEAVFSFDLPISVRFELESGTTLSSLTTILLTKTWFGDTTSGTPCFLWPVRLDAPLPERRWSLVRCIVRVRNQAKSPLLLRQFTIESEVLSLWTQGDNIVTNEILLEGQPDGSLRMAPLPASGVEPGDVIYQAPLGQTERMIKRGVWFLRNIAGIS